MLPRSSRSLKRDDQSEALRFGVDVRHTANDFFRRPVDAIGCTKSPLHLRGLARFTDGTFSEIQTVEVDATQAI